MTVPAHLDDRFRAAAAASGLLDAVYDLVDSPTGPLLVAATARGVCRISFDPEPERELEALGRTAGLRVLRAPGPVEQARRELDEYFAGRRRTFDLAVDLAATAPFQRAVLDELVTVPYGKTATYGELAARIGRPGAARAVGGALNTNPVPIVVPCHRIVGAGGSLTGYGGGLERKRLLLDLEAGSASLPGLP